VLARSWGRRPERHRRRRCWRPRVEELESRVTPNAYTVNLLGDSSGSAAGSSTGTYSGDLRYCLNAAIQDQQTDTITFDPTVFNSPQTIALSALSVGKHRVILQAVRARIDVLEVVRQRRGTAGNNGPGVVMVEAQEVAFDAVQDSAIQVLRGL